MGVLPSAGEGGPRGGHRVLRPVHHRGRRALRCAPPAADLPQVPASSQHVSCSTSCRCTTQNQYTALWHYYSHVSSRQSSHGSCKQPLQCHSSSCAQDVLRGTAHRNLCRFDFVPYGETLDDNAERDAYFGALRAYILRRVGAAIAATWPDLADAPRHIREACYPLPLPYLLCCVQAVYKHIVWSTCIMPACQYRSLPRTQACRDRQGSAKRPLPCTSPRGCAHDRCWVTVQQRHACQPDSHHR